MKTHSTWQRAAALALLLAIVAPPATAEPHPWWVPAPRLVKETYFSNLRDGESIETPFVARFGLRGFGLAPIVKPVPGAGHHHLLVDRELPMDFSKPLPFDEKYIHFGKGQMETVLTLAPGKYQLRLVLADDKHIPNFVYSKPVAITVTKKNATDPKSMVRAGVAILAPQAGAALKAPFLVAMHASGLNVSSAALTEKGSGHFRLRIKPERGAEEIVNLSNGHTEAWLRPPAGAYSVRVEMVDNAAPDQVLATSTAVNFVVER